MELAEFDIRSIPDNRTIIIYGKDGTGKTTTIERILKACNTTHVSFSKRDTFSEPLLESCIKDRQAGSMPSPNMMVVIDDVLCDIAWSWRPIRSIFLNGMCMRVGCIITMAYPIKLSPLITSNTDYLLIFNMATEGDLQQIYTLYALEDLFKTFDAFKQTKESTTCIVVALIHPHRAAYALKMHLPTINI